MHVTGRHAADEVGSIKRSARLLSREKGMPHRQALDILARQAGHSHWGSYLSALTASSLLGPGWNSEGGFMSYPPLMQALIQRPDVIQLAINADGSAWIDTGSSMSPYWRLLQVDEIDTPEAIRSFMDTVPVHSRFRNGLTFLAAGETKERGSCRFIARRPRDGEGPVEIAVRKGPRKDDPRLARDIRNWQDPEWHVDLVSGPGPEAISFAGSIAAAGRPRSTRLLTMGVSLDRSTHPNTVAAYSDAYDERTAVDFGMRCGCSGFVALCDTPARAAAAMLMARTGHGPAVLVVDAPRDEALSRLIGLATIGNVDPHDGMRQSMARAVELLPDQHTLHA